jgi:hypothetical protein
MTAHILEAPVRWWKCPACGKGDRTQNPDVTAVQFHECPALNNVAIPLVEVKDLDANPHARQILVPSEYGPGSASVRTERLDGSNDCTVFPGPAVARTD